jgi:signal peptidase I
LVQAYRLGAPVSRLTSRLPAILIAGTAGLAARAVYDRFGRFEVSEASMSPALRPGDYVVTDRAPRSAGRGDIVVFEHPNRSSFFLVKRIVGMPGERPTIESGQALVDGTPLDAPWTTDETGPDGTWELAPDQAFVLGDARWMSAGDSRELGPVSIEQLGMRIVFRYWPLERFGPVD